MRIWIDVEDLFQYVTANRRPSGIQRLAFELQAAMRALAGEGQVQFLRHVLPGNSFAVVQWEEVEALFQNLADHQPRRAAAKPKPAEPPWRSRLRSVAYRLPVPLRVALARCFRAQAAAIKAQFDALRALMAALRAVADAMLASVTRTLGAGQVALVPLAAVVERGDTIAVLGSPWSNTQYAAMLKEAKARHGMKVVVLLYDLIPIRHPEWVDRGLVQMFSHWCETCLPLADHLFAISRSTATDVERYAAARGIALAGPVHTIPIGTGFAARDARIDPADAARLPPAGTYVLFVSTIEARKNHQILFRAWRQMLEDMAPEDVPTLVFAGREGWLVQDLMQQLRNAAWLGGKIVFVDNPSDAELVQLYRGCLFTVFPSLYEGWGLPVTESLSLGKPCIASGVTSLPEAGGTLARYVNPNDLADVVRTIRAAFSDRADLAAWTARVEREFRPVSWDEGARAILEHLA